MRGVHPLGFITCRRCVFDVGDDTDNLAFVPADNELLAERFHVREIPSREILTDDRDGSGVVRVTLVESTSLNQRNAQSAKIIRTGDAIPCGEGSTRL